MTKYELEASELAWPVDWTAVYGRAAPLLVEIGFGGGHFLIGLAQQRPEANVLGVEITRPGIRRGVQKLRVAGLSNGRILQADANYLLWACCAPASVSEVYINFPDPWPKPREQHRRLINGRFLALLATRLPPGGQLHIATDVADYATAIAADLGQSPHFESVYDTPFVTDVDGRGRARVRTKYEQLALAAGSTCHYFAWQRNQMPAKQEFPVPQETPMPHVILYSPLTMADIANQFSPLQETVNDIHVRLPMLFAAQSAPMLLAEAYISEEPVSQRVGLLIRQRDDHHHYLIGLSEIGFPRPTPGVQLAIACLARWLISLHPDTAVQRSNIPYLLDP